MLHFARLAVFSALVFHTCSGRTSGQEAVNQKPNYRPAEIETGASRVFVFVDKTGFGHQHGIEAKLSSGKLILGAEKDAGQLVFDMQTFDADTKRARKYVGLSGTTKESTRSAVNENMKGAYVLDVARYPTATFVVNSSLSSNRTSTDGLPIYRLDGEFTLHGKKQPISFRVKVEQTRGWLHVRGNFMLKQTDYGITPFSKAFGTIGVADELLVYGDLYVAPSSNFPMASIPEQSIQ